MCNSGSTGRIAEDIAKITDAHNWGNHIAFGRNSPPSKVANPYQISSNKQLYFNILQARFLDNDGFLNSANTKKLVEKIDSINPSIIHLHNIHGYYLDLRVLFKYIKEKNIATVFTLHDCWSFTGHCAYFDFANCDKWKSLCEKCPQKSTYPKSIFLDRSKQNFLAKKEFIASYKNLHLVPVSDWLSDLLEDSIYKNTDKTVIKNGINLDVFKPINPSDCIYAKYPIKGKFAILGVASPWNQRKGFSDFLKLSAMLKDDEIIVMVGLDDKQVELIKKSYKNIIPIKRTANTQELAEIYTACNVFFNPTYEDNYPTTNMEAQSCGTPVVCYDTGGAKETFDEGTTGFHIEKGNLDMSLNALRKVKELGKDSFAENLKTKSQKDFNMTQCFAKYYELYKKLLGDS